MHPFYHILTFVFLAMERCLLILLQGKVGLPGAQGVPGSTGLEGKMGPKGDQGLPGFSGDTGPKGEAVSGYSVRIRYINYTNCSNY